MAMVCVSLTEKDAASTLKAARGLDCDIIEARLDSMADCSGLERLNGIRQRLMVTCMPVGEGGKFRGSEAERARLLESCLGFADYVSVELRMPPKLRKALLKKAKRSGAKAIVTFHDASGTPSKGRIIEILRRQERAGADIAKVAFRPSSIADVLSVIDAQAECKLRIPVIAISTGPLGRLSRVAGPMIGGYLTFAAPSAGRKADSGQLTVGEVKAVGGILWRR
jgi:3-dehydroquinate dehydratase-1